MGVFRKKTVTRGTEGGLKYICDVCSGDITSTVGTQIRYMEFILTINNHPRFAFDALILPVMIMTSVYHALPKAKRPVIMTQDRILIVSLSSILYQFSQKIGVLMKSCCF